VLRRLAPAQGVEEVRITDEDEYFPPPRELRDLLAAVDVLATLAAGGSVPDRPGITDRELAASDVLAVLR
jgi:4-hydroxy-3-methylbut-2-enyl diphosphate reductase